MAASSRSDQSGDKVKITLTGAQETMLAALVCRARDAKMPEPVLNDTWACQVLEQIDHDVDKFGIDDSQAIMHVLRARCLDRWVTDFLRHNAQATVVHLACGLDTKCLRLPWGSEVRWIDLDMPDVVDLRRKLLPSPDGDYQLVAADVADDAWLEKIPADRPTLIIAQGLLMYLDEPTGKRLIQRLVDHFKTGQLVVDFVGSIILTLQGYIKTLKATAATFKWGVNDPKELEALHTQLKMMDCLRPAELDGFEKVPFVTRLILNVYWYLPRLRNLSFYVRYRF
ncbi:putative polyketide synthase protein [Whalleya microplaca]|nr:putative polyketide synthase protein [Whalleya microplaca]